VSDVPRASEVAVDLAADVDEQVQRLGPREFAVGILTYNNAATVRHVAEAAVAGVEKHFPGVSAALINADAGSSDATHERLAGLDLPTVFARHDAPLTERSAVPFHGVPGRGAAIRVALTVAQRLGARVLVLLEADVISITDDWIERLAGPVLEHGADLVAATHARHRYDGTITNLVLRPLVRALYGRRLRQPLAGQQALSSRLIEHLLLHPRWNWSARDVADLWIDGTAIADGFSVWEAWLGRRTISSQTRTADLPAMMAQTLGAIFTLMDRHEDLWRDVRGSEPLPAVGEPTLPDVSPGRVDVERMVEGFRLGLRDLTSIWEHILAAETMSEVFGLDGGGPGQFRFPDDLWARVVYDFALGHHYAVVHREHLLRSLVPLYLGRAAAFVNATVRRDAGQTEAAVDAVGAAFEHRKPYLVEHWR
jgi:glucosylglycerate synthase